VASLRAVGDKAEPKSLFFLSRRPERSIRVKRDLIYGSKRPRTRPSKEQKRPIGTQTPQTWLLLPLLLLQALPHICLILEGGIEQGDSALLLLPRLPLCVFLGCLGWFSLV